MPAEAEGANAMSSAARGRSVVAGDVPETLGRRYFTDGRGGAGLGFYVDARVQTPAFRDRGRRLETGRNDPNAIRDMVAIARHREWQIVSVRGTAEFRREAWLVARAAGIEVRGYQATERDMQELERRRAAEQRRKVLELRSSPDAPERAHASDAARASMRVVETVVRSRLVERSAQERILTAARERLTRLLEQGVRIRAVPLAGSVEPEAASARERLR
jgi:hypothetical protein